MNKILTKIVLLLALSLSVSHLQAQFTTTFAKNVNPGQQSGFYYSLPQTMLKLDFVIEEVQCEPGPLSGYASMYFSMDESIEYASTAASNALPEPTLRIMPFGKMSNDALLPPLPLETDTKNVAFGSGVANFDI